MNVIIIDSHPERLDALLPQLDADISISGFYQDGETGVAAILQQLPDTAFINIDLTGMHTLETLGLRDQTSVELIFLSEWATYAYEAFQFGATDFLLKPLQENELKRTINRVTKTVHQKTLVRDAFPIIKNLMPRLRNIRIPVQHSDTIDYIPIRQIVRCEYEPGGCNLILRNRRTIRIETRNNHLEEQLLQLPFQRVNASCVVNLFHVEQYQPKNDRLILRDGKDVPLSTTLRSEVLMRLNHW